MSKDKIISTIMSWGVGAVLMIGGALAMIFHTKLDMSFPTYLYVGLSILIVGFIVWFVGQLFQFLQHKRDCKIEQKTE